MQRRARCFGVIFCVLSCRFMVFSPMALQDRDDGLRHQRDELSFAFGFQHQARTVVLVVAEFECNLLYRYVFPAGSTPSP